MVSFFREGESLTVIYSDRRELWWWYTCNSGWNESKLSMLKKDDIYRLHIRFHSVYLFISSSSEIT